MEWFVFAIIASVLFGIQSFLYKTSNERGCNKYLVTLVFMITVEVLALFTFLFKGITFAHLFITSVLGFFLALLFYLKTIGQIKALEYLPTNKVFPISSSAVILTVVLALFLFQESLTLTRVVGIVAIVLAVMLIHRDSKGRHDYSKKKIGFLISFLVILPASGMELINKYAAITVDLSSFILITYLFAVLISIFSHQIKKKRQKKRYSLKESIIVGIVIGVVNFAGYFASLTAMKTGPLSLIAPILNASLILTVVLAKTVHREELTLKQFLLVVLTVLGVILLRV